MSFDETLCEALALPNEKGCSDDFSKGEHGAYDYA